MAKFYQSINRTLGVYEKFMRRYDFNYQCDPDCWRLMNVELPLTSGDYLNKYIIIATTCWYCKSIRDTSRCSLYVTLLYDCIYFWSINCFSSWAVKKLVFNFESERCKNIPYCYLISSYLYTWFSSGSKLVIKWYVAGSLAVFSCFLSIS